MTHERGVRARLVVLLAVIAMVSLGLGVLPRPAPAETDTKRSEAPTVVPPTKLKHRVIAYYFCYNFRCARCRAFEAYSQEALQSAFPEHLKDGRLVWRIVNVETRGNEHFVKDYGLYTKSLVLVDETRGRKPQWKNLEKIWQLVGDKEAFVRYVQDETRAYLEDRRS